MTDFPHPPELEALPLFEVWRDAPELGASFDPFRFSQRMAAYRQLLYATNTDALFGPDNRTNPLWGLMFQHQWQFRTGRLGRETPAADAIDPNAPWGYGNYLLCVVPWLGAAAAGVVPDLAIAPPRGRTHFRYASGGGDTPLDLPAELLAPVADWKRFFALVKNRRRGQDQEPIRLALWKAHKTSLDVVTARLVGIDPYPNTWQEHVFLRGWCRLVDYLWAAAWPTDFDFMVANGLDVLPERTLKESDAALHLADMGALTRSNVRHIVQLAWTPAYRHKLNLMMWRRLMRTRAAREEVRSMLGAVFSPSSKNLGAALRLVRYAVVR